MQIQEIVNFFNEGITLFLVLPGIIILGAYYTFRLRFLQLTKLGLSAKSLLQSDQKEQGNISHYQALAAVIAGNLGTGNISGMAVALSTGGPGALVWMWVMALFGSMIQYASCVLGVKYRQKDEAGEYVGGPMYYLSSGLGLKKIATLFAFVTMIAAITVGNFAQINSIVLPLSKLGMPPLWGGVLLAFVVGVVTLGGITRLAKVSSSVVPVMAVVYLLAALVVLAVHLEHIPLAFQKMIRSAFDVKSAAGGALGFGIFKAMTIGFKRGVFATDAGTGIVPILQASARTKSPVIDGIVTLIAPFIVMIMCTTTGLILMVSGAFDDPSLQSTNMVTYAFSRVFGDKLGCSIVIIALFLFAYTTIIAWGCCGEKAAEFLWGRRSAKWFQYTFLLLVPIGAITHVDLVWILADTSISFMLLTNLVAVGGLSKEVISDTRAYFGMDRKRVQEGSSPL
jgi:AGCS family alanine or glycine:cation symporter